jgi:dihydroorotase-like cyclic amidohydrolase
MIHNPKKNPQGNFKSIPNGLPGVETRSPILWSEGVLKGKITRQRFVELNSANAAKLCESLFSFPERAPFFDLQGDRWHVPQE